MKLLVKDSNELDSIGVIQSAKQRDYLTIDHTMKS